MSNTEFEKKIAAIMRTLNRLRAAQRGELDVKHVPVKRHFVPGFWVQKHSRTIYTKRKEAKQATKRAA